MPLRIQVLSCVLWISFIPLTPKSVWADDLCFDFSKKTTAPLKSFESLQEPALPVINGKSGALDSGIVWAMVRGVVERPLSSILSEIEDHQSTRSKRIDHMNVKAVADPNYLMRQDVSYEVDPFPLITVKWVEQWAYTLLQGSAADPKEVLISVQKSKGTSHISHYCSSYVLTQLSPQTTEVSIYEETKATGRSQEDTQNGIEGTIKTLRSSGVHAAPQPAASKSPPSP